MVYREQSAGMVIILYYYYLGPRVHGPPAERLCLSPNTETLIISLHPSVSFIGAFPLGSG